MPECLFMDSRPRRSFCVRQYVRRVLCAAFFMMGKRRLVSMDAVVYTTDEQEYEMLSGILKEESPGLTVSRGRIDGEYHLEKEYDVAVVGINGAQKNFVCTNKGVLYDTSTNYRRNSMKKKLVSIIIMILFSISMLTSCAKGNAVAKTPEDLYRDAVRDAAFADEDEILPLVSLVENNPMTTWQDGKVLLLTWHNYPDSYPQGGNVTIQWGPVWVFTDKEIASHAEDLQKADNAEARLKQIIAFAPDSEHSTVTGFWVDPKNVKRPAYQSNPTIDAMSNSFDENVDENFKAWFDDNTLWSYYYGDYPWTRLGYTYDWADNGTEYGMTEFIVEDGAEVTVEFTETTEEFLNRITNIEKK